MYQSPEDYTIALAAHVDGVAQSRQYTDASSCATYVTSRNVKYAAEAVAFIAWRDDIFEIVEQAMADVAQGAEPPNVADFIATLPIIVWPVGE